MSTDAGFWSAAGHDSVEETDSATPAKDVPVEYGVDVSFPMHHNFVSTNYAWLPHNTDTNAVTPRKLQDMPIQPLGDRETFYKKFLDGCVEAFGSRGRRCIQNESDRVAMSLRQPQSMQVRFLRRNGLSFCAFRTFVSQIISRITLKLVSKVSFVEGASHISLIQKTSTSS